MGEFRLAIGSGERGKMPDFKNIRYEVKERVAHITLNRPEKMNALSYDLRRESLVALKTAERDDDVGCIIIKGAGRTFCAGYDFDVTGWIRESAR